MTVYFIKLNSNYGTNRLKKIRLNLNKTNKMFTPRQRHERLQCLTGRGLHVQYLAAFGMVLLRLHCQSHTANRSFYLTRRLLPTMYMYNMHGAP